MTGAAERTAGYPAWLRFVDSVLPVTTLFVVHGNIRDVHVVPGAHGAMTLHETRSALRSVLELSGIGTMVTTSPLHGVSIDAGSDETTARAALGDNTDLVGTGTVGFADIARAVQAVASAPEHPCAIVVDYLSQVARHPSGQIVEPAEELFQRLLGIVHARPSLFTRDGARMMRRNPIILLLDRPNDLPAWLVTSDGIRQVPIPDPDLSTRLRAARSLYAQLAPGPDTGDAELIVQRFVGSTHGMSLRAMMEIIQLMRDEGLPSARVDDGARLYRAGVVEDPWRAPELAEQIARGPAALERRVKGQAQAIQHALDILIRSVTGMTAAHRAGADGPRGVMFFAGPTGVGKTELAKTIAQLLFGDESAYVRFDMSEFAQEAADQRLIGSPPGYVNHDAGGELTNAVRDRPFSVLLFDEIEKAHPRVLDKFLQILSDGRLSDGSGDTVFFNDTLIIFTSNLGIGGSGTTAEDCAADPVAYRRALTSEIERAFVERYRRPELLGRIGDNIVVFDYIDPETARIIAGGFIDNALTHAQRSTGVQVRIGDAAREQVISATVEDLSTGARGVGNQVESFLVNPLARALFGAGVGDTRTIVAVERGTDGQVTIRWAT
ncbi:AAA family ATPase [Microbacterium karelineae]|uniref:AAA family ATPase n=1 Tax=Microbacterium karelineae TaxID=2654283 RepID=UPI0012E9C2C4|nr:AAA family ATPase [Microbacterium karelineae]